jgi:hypothetical protein
MVAKSSAQVAQMDPESSEKDIKVVAGGEPFVHEEVEKEEKVVDVEKSMVSENEALDPVVASSSVSSSADSSTTEASSTQPVHQEKAAQAVGPLDEEDSHAEEARVDLYPEDAAN